jgi:predicted acylesterase/phospholipase RssA/CRP-like cAMP-binding protein
MVTVDKFLLLKLHPCADGLSDEVVREISEQCELLRCESGEILHKANDPFAFIYLVIHGRIKLSLIDIQGHVLLERYQIPGTQIGALAAASGEPTPMQVEVIEPSTLLRLSYQTVFELTKQHDVFRQNMSRIIAEAVNSTLMGERRKKLPRLISIFHQAPVTRQLSRRLVSRLQELGQNPYLVHDQTDWNPIDGITDYCILQNGHHASDSEIRQQIDKMPDRKPIIIDLDAATEIKRMSNIFEISEKVLWIVTPDNWTMAVAKLAEIERQSPRWRDKVNIVWLLPGSMPWAPQAPELKSLAIRDFKVSLDEPPEHRSRVMMNGFERLVHEIRGVRIGLALGGGAARGMAHLGVLQVLEKNGICVDMIAGTSAGAMTGILYASGMSPEYSVERFVKDLTPSWFFRRIPNGGHWYLLYMYRRGQFDTLLRKYLKDSRLEQLPIPVHSVTVDLISGQPVVREEGDAVNAILESINVPVLSKPINRDGRALVDGGIINNVPANTLVAKGCNFVIAVSVTAKIKEEFASNNPNTLTEKMKSASVLETIMRTYVVQNVNMNSVGVQPADFVIQPDVRDFDITEFSRADEMSAIGAETALELLPKLKQILSRVDDKLFEIK